MSNAEQPLRQVAGVPQSVPCPVWTPATCVENTWFLGVPKSLLDLDSPILGAPSSVQAPAAVAAVI